MKKYNNIIVNKNLKELLKLSIDEFKIMIDSMINYRTHEFIAIREQLQCLDKYYIEKDLLNIELKEYMENKSFIINSNLKYIELRINNFENKK